jgi:hypothetical protein
MGIGFYDTAQICLNGHVVTGSSVSLPQFKKNFCDKCGAKTIDACPKCKAPIKGNYDAPGISIAPYSVPRFCDACGQPYPWTEARIKAAQDLSDELDKLTPEDKETLKKSIDDIIRDTLQTQVAATRFKKLVAKAGADAATALRQILMDIASETAKKAIWG